MNIWSLFSWIKSILVPFSFIHFGIYDSLKDVVNPQNTYSPSTNALCGAVAGGVAAFVTTPLDVIKTVLNTQEGKLAAAGVNCDPCPTGESFFILRNWLLRITIISSRIENFVILRCYLKSRWVLVVSDFSEWWKTILVYSWCFPTSFWDFLFRVLDKKIIRRKLCW